MTRVAYLGAWEHIQVAQDLLKKGIQEFICIDTQPRSEWDQPTFFPELYRLNFTNSLQTTCKEFGFNLVSSTVLDSDYIQRIGISTEMIDSTIRAKMNSSTTYKDACPTLLTFKNQQTDQTIRYYISTNILWNMCPLLEEDLNGCSGLVISGYSPAKEILLYLPKDVVFYCYSDTVYHSDEETIGTIMDVLNTGIYHLIDYNTGRHLSTHASMNEIRNETRKLREQQ